MANKSEYQLSSSVNEGVLEVILTGKVITGTVEDLQIKIAEIINAKRVKNLLVDARALRGPRIGTLETYTTVRRPLPDIPKVNVAVVDRPENATQGGFLETTAHNAGHSLKFFTDIDEAREWLKSKQSK